MSAEPNAVEPVTIAIVDRETMLRDSLSQWLSRDPRFKVLGAYRTLEALLESPVNPSVVLYGRDRGVESDEPLAHLIAQRPQTRVLLATYPASDSSVQQWRRMGVAALAWKTSSSCDDLARALVRVASGDSVFPSNLVEGEIHGISLRELEVLEHVAAGEDNLQIAARLGITERTVKAHVSNLYRKLAVETRVALALAAWRAGAVEGALSAA